MPWSWLIFLVIVLLLLALDLGLHRKSHAVSMREALAWSGFWVALGLAFTAFIYLGYENQWLGLGKARDAVDGAPNDGSAAAVKYLTGYVIKKSLSVDNIFVIAMLFRYFAVPARYQHRVLFWGILGALAMRGAMIAVGVRLIEEFEWLLYAFGAFLLFAAVQMLWTGGKHGGDPGKNPVVRLARRFFPVADEFHGPHFMVRAGTPEARETDSHAPDRAAERAGAGTWMLTPLALALIMVETTDLIFAVDSIPAIFAITTDPYLVFTSNVFAILGLRALYFALAGLMDKFRYLNVSLAAVLALVGAKMLAADWIKEMFGKNYNFHLLGAILLILAAGVAASLLAGPKPEHADVARRAREAGEET